MLVTWVISAGIVITGLLTASLLQTAYGFSLQHALSATSVGTLFFMLGAVISGATIDRIGPGPCFMGGSIIFALATLSFYANVGSSLLHLYVLYSWMGLAGGLMAAMPYLMVLSFPPRVRVTGISFSYNIAYAVCGGLTPPLIAWLVELDRMAPAYYLVFIALVACGIGDYVRRHPASLQPHEEDLLWGSWAR